MTFLRRPLLAALVLIPLTVHASDFGMEVSKDAVRGEVTYSEPEQPVSLGAAYTYHEGSRHLLDLGLHAQGQTALFNYPATVGLGFLAMNFVDDDTDTEGSGVGLGGFLRMNIPQVPGLAFTAAAHYAPKILSFGDSEAMTQLNTALSYRVIRNAEVAIGYRFEETDFENAGDLTLNEGGYIGLSLYF